MLEGRPKKPAPGETFAGKYRVERILGEGGMGLVFEAMHLRLRQSCAIKMLIPGALANPEWVARFEREARVAATLRHPHVVQILDVDTTPDGVPFMVIELLRGHDLADEIASRGPLPVDEAAGHALTACSALAHAHAKGIIHRDLKPSNLFLHEEDDGARRLKLLDFGISKITNEDEAHITSSASIFGTPFYMSPEQVRNVKGVDARSDLWSLGVVLYEMLAGRVPFGGPATAVVAAIAADPVVPPRTHRDVIPEELERVVLKALQKDVAQRWATAEEMASALEPFASDWARPLVRQSSGSRQSRPEITRAPDLEYARTQELPSEPDLEPAAAAEAPSPAEQPAPTPLPAAQRPATVGKTWSAPPATPTRPPTRVRVFAALAVVGVAAAIGVALIVRAAIPRQDSVAIVSAASSSVVIPAEPATQPIASAPAPAPSASLSPLEALTPPTSTPPAGKPARHVTAAAAPPPAAPPSARPTVVAQPQASSAPPVAPDPAPTKKNPLTL